jgi:hypothetical protein
LQQRSPLRSDTLQELYVTFQNIVHNCKYTLIMRQISVLFSNLRKF